MRGHRLPPHGFRKFPNRSIWLGIFLYSNSVKGISGFEAYLRDFNQYAKAILAMDTDSRPQSSKPALDQLTQSGGGTAHEFRKSVRIPYQSTVELNSSTGPAKGATRNISTGGLFVDTKISSCVGQKLEMNFWFRSGYHSMKLQAQVVRETSEGLGLRLL